ncbi:MAG TPA: tetratricopeptide repeat protein [Patescibacteria group bacterium]|nr:tetratricopeptide repeat protein [Patescibacteria group bacterium]
MTIPLRTKISLVLGGFLMFLILLEVGLRLGGFIVLSLQEYRNQQAMRHKEACRILCLGESTTVGQYPPYLEKILNQRHVEIRFSVIDTGIIAANSATILSQLESNIARYRPDIVVVMMGSNDQGILYYKDIPEARTPLFYRCKTYRLIKILWARAWAKTRGKGGSGKDSTFDPQGNNAHIRLGPMHQAENSPKERTYIQLGWNYRAEGNTLLAENAFKKAIELSPRNDNAYVALGLLYQAQGQFSQAEDLLKKAAALNPQNDDTVIKLGWLYQGQNKLSQAEDAFKQAIVSNSFNAFKLGRLCCVRGKPSLAENAFKKAIELNPRNDSVYVALGLLYQAQGKLLEAEGAFSKAVECNPKNIRAYPALWEFYRNNGRRSQLEDACKQAIAFSPSDYRAYAALSVLYEETGRSALAEEYAQKANSIKSHYCAPMTVTNYRAIREILDKNGIRLICVQYPMRDIGPLKRVFQDNAEGIIFVDNEKLFKDAVKGNGYNTYFRDMFGGDFGHCTDKGNRLLAENIANAILKEVFHK